MDSTLLLLLLGAALTLLGIAGLLLPALPGMPLIFIGLLISACAEDLAYVGWRTLTVLGGLTILGILADFLAGSFGARHFGASRRAAVGAALGAVVGLFFGIAGVLLGPFIGAVVCEFTVRSDLRASGRAGIGAALGLALAVAAKMALAFAMIGLFLAVRFI